MAALDAVARQVETWLDSVESEGREIPEPQGDLRVKPKEKQGRGGRRQERIEKRRHNRERARQERESDQMDAEERSLRSESQSD